MLLFFMNYFIVAVTAFVTAFTVSNCIHYSFDMKSPAALNTREDSTHGRHQMVNTEIRLIIFFAVKDGEVLYSQQKQDWELTVG